MKVLLDQGVPAPLRSRLHGFDVWTAPFLGWSDLTNGALLAAAEQDGFDVLVTTDQALQHQQTLRGRRIAVVVLTTTRWARIRACVPRIKSAVAQARSGAATTVDIP